MANRQAIIQELQRRGVSLPSSEPAAPKDKFEDVRQFDVLGALPPIGKKPAGSFGEATKNAFVQTGQDVLDAGKTLGRAGLIATKNIVGGGANILDLLASPINAVSGMAGIPPANYTKATRDFFDDATGGITKPRSPLEESVQNIGEAVASTPYGGYGVAKMIGNTAKNVGAKTIPAINQYLSNPANAIKADAIGGGLATSASEAVRQAGGNPILEMAAGITASLLAPATAPRSEARRLAGEAVDMGMPITVGQATGTDLARKAEKTMEQGTFTGHTLRQNANAQNQFSKNLVTQASSDIAPNMTTTTKNEVGAVLQEGLQRGQKNVSKQIGEIYKPLENMVDFEKTPFAPTKVTQIADDLALNFKGNKAAQKLAGYDELKDVINAYKGPLSLREAKNLKDSVYDLQQQLIRDGKKKLAAKVGDLYRAVDDDIKTVITNMNPAAGALYKQLDAQASPLYRMTEKVSGYFDASPKGKQAESLYNTFVSKITNGQGADADTIMDLAKVLPEDAMREVSAYHLNNMGIAKIAKGQGLEEQMFSASKFADEWQSLTPEARQTIFKPFMKTENYEALNRMTRISKRLKIEPANPSGTAAEALGWGGLTYADPTSAVVGILASNAAGSNKLARAILKIPMPTLRSTIQTGSAGKMATLLRQYGIDPITQDEELK
jgi:hypothetical protein